MDKYLSIFYLGICATQHLNSEKLHQLMKPNVAVTKDNPEKIQEGGIQMGDLETFFPAMITSAIDQFQKLDCGNVKSITTFFNTQVLLHVHQAPLVITLLAPRSMYVGKLMKMAETLGPVFHDIQLAIEASENSIAPTSS